MFGEALGGGVTKRIDETVLVAVEIGVPCPAREGVTCASLEGVTSASLEGVTSASLEGVTSAALEGAPFACRFVENDISGHHHLPAGWVVEPIGLRPILIAQEHHLGAPIFKLPKSWLDGLHVPDAAKRA